MFYKMIEKVYRQSVYNRADDNGCIFYFSKDDFEGLQQEKYPFKSSRGHQLQGCFYYYEGYQDGRIVIFEHGMGSGHRGYMKEIELLAKHGYLVFAYDHTGCMESGGETTFGFTQSLMDLNDAVSALKKDPKYQGMTLSVVGHSWGGFSTLNITALHPDIKHVVAMSGFISVESMIRQAFGGVLSRCGQKIYAQEAEQNPEYIRYNALETLKNTKAQVLVLHSEDDQVVKCSEHFDVMQAALVDKENITFVKLQGKAHNPNYTEEAVKYKDAFFAAYQKALKKKQFKTEADKQAFKAGYDWNKMTGQDMKVWKMIFEVLDR